MSLELETLDQLAGGDLSLAIIRGLYPTAETFMQGTLGLLFSGDVRLFTNNEIEVPRWRWRQLFIDGIVLNELDKLRLKLTEQGGRKV